MAIWIVISLIALLAVLAAVLAMTGFKARQGRIEAAFASAYPGATPIRCLVVTPGIRVPGVALLLPGRLVFQGTVDGRETVVEKGDAALEFASGLVSGKPVFGASVVRLEYGESRARVEFVVNDPQPWKKWWEGN